MSKYLNLEKQLVRLYRSDSSNKEVIKQFLLTACIEDAQEVRHGQWKDIEHAPDGLLYVTCSVCGKRQTVEFTNYCGNCGAKMDGDAK